MAQFRLAVLGECMIELQQKGADLKRSYGGDTLNTAVYFSRLTRNADIKTAYITALGNDSFSNEMIQDWDREGIHTNHILRIDNKSPGLYFIETDDTGERSFHYWRNDAAAKYLLEQKESLPLLADLMDYDALYLSGISIAILTPESRAVLFQFLPEFKKQGGKIIFDNNYRPKLWDNKQTAINTYREILSYTDIALLTYDDDQDLYGDTDIEQCIERTQSLGVTEIVLKRGKDDCQVLTKEETGDERQSVPATVVENVVDTTAAGDSFSGGYLAKRFMGGTAQESALAGHRVAGTVIQHRGAVIPAEAIPAI